MEIDSPFSQNSKYKILLSSFLIGFLISISANLYLMAKLKSSENVVITNECPAVTQCDCPSFDWVDRYLEIKEGEIPWSDCGEGNNKCAFWEDYSAKSPLPKVEIKECPQEGTRIEEGVLVTGLPVGEHIIIGATVRPCKVDTLQ